MRRWITTSFIALVALGVSVVPTHADLISGNFDGVAVLTPTAPNVFLQTFTGDGDDTLLGSFTAQSTSIVDFSNPPHFFGHDGMFSQVFSMGTLNGTTSGMGTANGDGTASFVTDLVFTGGTEFFAGATGEATITGTLVRVDATTVTVTASYVGTLAPVPEPGSLALLAPALAIGAGVLVGRATRRCRGKASSCPGAP